MKYLDRILSMVLGAIFIYASYDKILNPAEFAAIIKDYKVLPLILVNPVAIILPWLELCIGVLLVISRLRTGALFLANVLLAVFWSLLVFNYFRGIDVNCGCFSTSPDASGSMMFSIVRDGLLLVFGMAAMWVHRKMLKPARTSY